MLLASSRRDDAQQFAGVLGNQERRLRVIPGSRFRMALDDRAVVAVVANADEVSPVDFQWVRSRGFRGVMIALVPSLESHAQYSRAGADDALPRPVLPDDLELRLEVGMRRRSALAAGDLELRAETNTLRKGGKQRVLPPKEFRILITLADATVPVPAADLRLAALGAGATQRNLNTRLCALRKALREIGSQVVIELVRGHYRLRHGTCEMTSVHVRDRI
jgi:DNA-binding winged helix-turn-helix (wHTH) protein